MVAKKLAAAFGAGALATIALRIAIGASHTSEPVTGRFQIAAGANYAAYVVDTATGQVWSTTGETDFNKPKLPPANP